MNKKLIISVVVVVAVVLMVVSYLLLKSTKKDKQQKKKSDCMGKFNENDATEALRKIYKEYGREMAINIEKMYRQETAHFKSKQYISTGSPGMEAHGEAPYYGWASTPWKKRPELAPCGLVGFYENKGMSGTAGANAQVTDKQKQFLVFDSVYAAMYALAEYIKRYNGNYARWYSTTAQGQQIYRDRLAKIRPRIVDNIT